MATKKKVKATKLTIGLPFNLGSLEFENDETQQRAAWTLYVELSTQINLQSFKEEFMLREALTDLYNIFSVTRKVLSDAGPEIARGPRSFGTFAIDVLNVGLSPFLSKWHPLLRAYEEKKPIDKTTLEYENSWEHAQELRNELNSIRGQLTIYMDALAKISGID